MIIFLHLFTFQLVFRFTTSTASNSLADCNKIVSTFRNTCNGNPVSLITSTTGKNVSCSTGFTADTCPGVMYGNICVFQHKLCVSCSGSNIVRIRVQSNGLPEYCPNVPHKMQELNIDFEVNFNPDVNVNSPIHDPLTMSDLSSIVCNINNQASVPSASNFQSNNEPKILSTLAGISVDGVMILNVNSANNVDPFYPTGGFEAESVDSCLGHPNPSTNGYHYHAASGCALDPPTVAILPCRSKPECSASIADYSISMFSSHRSLTVIGIAKDGHVIYGPYDSTGTEVTSGFDTCNGMFYDSIGNYAYFTTRTFPYITGCFGPGNYPGVFPNCTTNKPSAYKKSTYALSQTTAGSNGIVGTLNYVLIIVSLTIGLVFEN